MQIINEKIQESKFWFIEKMRQLIRGKEKFNFETGKKEFKDLFPKKVFDDPEYRELVEKVLRGEAVLLPQQVLGDQFLLGLQLGQFETGKDFVNGFRSLVRSQIDSINDDLLKQIRAKMESLLHHSNQEFNGLIGKVYRPNPLSTENEVARAHSAEHEKIDEYMLNPETDKVFATEVITGSSLLSFLIGLSVTQSFFVGFFAALFIGRQRVLYSELAEINRRMLRATQIIDEIRKLKNYTENPEMKYPSIFEVK